MNMNLSMEKLFARYAISKKPILDIERVQVSTQLKVSKLLTNKWHTRQFHNDLVIDGAQIYLSPVAMLVYRYVLEIQTIYQNMNFSFYKEYFQRYLEMAGSRGIYDELDKDVLRESIWRTLDSRLRFISD